MARCLPVERLPRSADASRAALEAVAKEIKELERLCIEIDAAVVAEDWARLNAAIADSRRVTHGLENAMAEAKPYRDASFDKAAFARLQQIYSYRQERMKAVEETHHEIGERLRALSRWKGYARSIGGNRESTRRSAGLDSRR